MNQHLTWFRQRDPASPSPAFTQLRRGGREVTLATWAAAGLPEAAVPPEWRVNGDPEYREFQDRLAERLAGNGGGLVAALEEQQGSVTVELRAVVIGDYQPPRTLFRIDEDGVVRELPFASEEARCRLPPGGHLVVPVDADAERRFRSFRAEYAAWFPQDFEALLLGLLRKPGLDLLDARVARLEQILLDLAEGRSPESRRLFGWFDRRFGTSRGPSAPQPAGRPGTANPAAAFPWLNLAVLAVVVLLAGLALYIGFWENPTGQSTAPQPPAAVPAPAPESASPQPGPATPAPIPGDNGGAPPPLAPKEAAPAGAETEAPVDGEPPPAASKPTPPAKAKPKAKAATGRPAKP